MSLRRWLVRYVLRDFERRLTAKFTPALNTGSAHDALALVADVLREMKGRP